jgi:hypothetical protein
MNHCCGLRGSRMFTRIQPAVLEGVVAHESIQRRGGYFVAV